MSKAMSNETRRDREGMTMKARAGTSGVTYHRIMGDTLTIWKVSRETRPEFRKLVARTRKNGGNVIRLTERYVSSVDHGCNVIWW
jgi:hypothetical protein